MLACGVLAGCSSDKGEQKAEQPEQTAAASLEGKRLNIYCGAGMTKPFQEIADAFKAETGCEMNIAFANAAQIQTQRGMRTFLWTGYAASPRLLRYRIGLSHPSFSFGRSSL